MSGIAHRLAALQRIAAFSAAVRGHELGDWHNAEHFTLATCIRCHAEMRVYDSLIQPEMDGAALVSSCRIVATERAA